MRKGYNIFTDEFRKNTVMGMKGLTDGYLDHRNFMAIHLGIFICLAVLSLILIPLADLGMQHFNEQWVIQNPNTPVTITIVYYAWKAGMVLWQIITFLYGVFFVFGLFFFSLLKQAEEEFAEAKEKKEPDK